LYDVSLIVFYLDANENRTEKVKPFVYYGRYHRRVRRQSDQGVPDTAQTVLSILPLDRLGTIVGQIMSTGLKEMMNPDVGKKIVNVLENQGPLLLTSLFTNLYSTLLSPGRTPTTSIISSGSLNTDAIKQLTNTTTSELMNAIRRPAVK
jgi:hypothetical protein